MAHEDEFERRYNEARRRALGSSIHELFCRAARITELSLLTLLYRSIPPGKATNSVFCDECIASARAALEEHQRSISIITTSDVKGHPLEIYINCSFLLFPLFPFTVLFCHAVQTCEQSDLYLLKSVVETLESISESAFYQTCSKQIRLFRALYDVAESYIELKYRESGPQIAGSDFNQILTTIGVPILPQPPAVGGDFATSTASHNVSSSSEHVLGAPGTSFADIDETRLELGRLFQGNQEIFRLLDDSYLRQ